MKTEKYLGSASYKPILLVLIKKSAGQTHVFLNYEIHNFPYKRLNSTLTHFLNDYDHSEINSVLNISLVIYSLERAAE